MATMTAAATTAATLDKAHWAAFLFGGRATFGLTSSKTNKRLTFALRRAKQQKTSGQTMFWATWLPGVKAVVFVGWVNINDTTGKATYTEQSKARLDGEDKAASAALRYFFQRVFTGEKSNIILTHDGKCSMCRLPLHDPASVARGIGPECYKKQSKAKASSMAPIPTENNVVRALKADEEARTSRFVVDASDAGMAPETAVTPPETPQPEVIQARVAEQLDIIGVDDIWGAWRTKRTNSANN